MFCFFLLKVLYKRRSKFCFYLNRINSRHRQSISKWTKNHKTPNLVFNSVSSFLNRGIQLLNESIVLKCLGCFLIHVLFFPLVIIRELLFSVSFIDVMQPRNHSLLLQRFYQYPVNSFFYSSFSNQETKLRILIWLPWRLSRRFCNNDSAVNRYESIRIFGLISIHNSSWSATVEPFTKARFSFSF